MAADRQTLTWKSTSSPGPFDVARGDLKALHAAAGDYAGALCPRNDLTTTSTTDAALPPAGTGAYYLVRCDGGTWNDGTQEGDRDLTLAACP